MKTTVESTTKETHPILISEDDFRTTVQIYVEVTGGIRPTARKLQIDPGYLCDFLKGRKHGGNKLAAQFDCLPVIAFQKKKATEKKIK